LTILCDRIGLEILARDGLTYVPMPYLPKADDLSLEVQARGGPAKISDLQVHELRSAWSVPVITSSSSVRHIFPDTAGTVSGNEVLPFKQLAQFIQ
jgi:hypothetical protein